MTADRLEVPSLRYLPGGLTCRHSADTVRRSEKTSAHTLDAYKTLRQSPESTSRTKAAAGNVHHAQGVRAGVGRMRACPHE